MHRSIVIPKGTISPDKTTVIKVPVTAPENTTPLIVVNKQSPRYKPSDTQEFNPQQTPIPQQYSNQTQMYQSQRRYQQDETYRNQTAPRPNMNQTNNSPCDCNANKSPAVQSPPPNTSNIVAYCTDKIPEAEDDALECECNVDNDVPEVNDDVPYTENDDSSCFCDDYSNCKYETSQSQYNPASSNVNDFYNGTPAQLNDVDDDATNCQCSDSAPCQTYSNPQDTYQYPVGPSNDFDNYSSFMRGLESGYPTTMNQQPQNGKLCTCNSEPEETYPEDDELNCLCSPQSPCKVPDIEYAETEELDCQCSPQSPCKDTQGQYDSFQPTTSNRAPSFSRIQDSQYQNDYNDFVKGLNSSFAPPQTRGANSTFAPPQGGGFNSTFAPPQTRVANSTFAPPQGGGFNSTFAPPQGGGFNSTFAPPQGGGFNSTLAPPQRRASSSSANNRSPAGATSMQEGRTFNPATGKEEIICPVYLDSINEEEEHPSDNQLNPNMKIINVNSRTYTRIDDGPVQGRTFNFEDPERKGVSSNVFDQLAKSILEEPPEANGQDTFRTICTDRDDLLNPNDNEGDERNKRCKC